MISEANEQLCVGKIKTLDEAGLRLQNLMNEDESELEYYLSSKDIYKDLKLYGYEYGKHFQKLKYLRTNDFNTIRGQIEWSGNWITFVDSLLQSLIIAQPYRKMRVPTMIKYLRCNPKILSKAIKNKEGFRSESDDKSDDSKSDVILPPKTLNDNLKQQYDLFNSNLPLHVDTKLNVLVSPGIEIEGLEVKPINLLKEKQGLKLESYKFMVNQDNCIMQLQETADNKLENEHLIRSLIDIVSENNVPKKEIQVIEINLNSDLLAEVIKDYLEYFNLYQTDVKFVVMVESLEYIPDNFKNKQFNLIECGKNKSTNISHCFTTPSDLVIWNICYKFWPCNLEEELQNKHDLIIEKGFLLAVFKNETKKPHIQGEKEYHKNNIEDFLQLAMKIGFILIGSKRDSNDSRSFLFRKVDKVSITQNNIDNMLFISDEKNENNSKFSWFEKLKEKTTKNFEIDQKEDIWIVVKNCTTSGIIGLVNCLRQEPGGDMVKCIYNCDDIGSDDHLFGLKPELLSEILVKNLAINVIKDGELGTFRHLSLPSNFDQIFSEKYFLNMTDKKEISGLRWLDLNQSLASKTLNNELCENNSNQKEIDCDIYMSGLNFKDVMIAIGKHIQFFLIDNDFEK